MGTDDYLYTALDGLGSERLQRLADRLEGEPDVSVAVGRLSPLSPMVLAGVDLGGAGPDASEAHFADIWECLAVVQRRGVRRILGSRAAGAARRSDVQMLLRTVNTVLAERTARASRRDRDVRRRDEFPSHGGG
jgi:hypothetical protein